MSAKARPYIPQAMRGVCFECGERGHLGRDCPVRKANDGRRGKKRVRFTARREEDDDEEEEDDEDPLARKPRRGVGGDDEDSDDEPRRPARNSTGGSSTKGVSREGRLGARRLVEMAPPRRASRSATPRRASER